jgi:hypothetical protein
MNDADLETPVLLLVFNRPELTRMVFSAIRAARPRFLYIAADGPRENQPGEQERCAEARSVLSDIDWNCDVKTLFRNSNLGCRKACASAIDWFFESAGDGIILEDDCYPDHSFFRYCQELLARYRDDERVMHIGGNNFQFGWVRDPDYSYYFSKYGSIWGWASWRRAWKLYDVSMASYFEIASKGYLEDILPDGGERRFRVNTFDDIVVRNMDTWDVQWTYSKLVNRGLSIVPRVNLISNLGFGSDATHTTDAADKRARVSRSAMEFPLRHPRCMIEDSLSDRRYHYSNFGQQTKLGMIRRALLRSKS